MSRVESLVIRGIRGLVKEKRLVPFIAVLLSFLVPQDTGANLEASLNPSNILEKKAPFCYCTPIILVSY